MPGTRTVITMITMTTTVTTVTTVTTAMMATMTTTAAMAAMAATMVTTATTRMAPATATVMVTGRPIMLRERFTLKLEARPAASRRMRWLSPLAAVVLTLACSLLLFAALGKDPVLGFTVFFLHPLKDGYALSELLLKAAPLMLIATGLAIGYRANVWNIGAEGQFIAGAIAATGVALAAGEQPAPYTWVLMLAAGALGGMAWGALPALLRTRFNANEILVTLMMVYLAQLLASWLVHGPWKNPEGFNFPQTRLFADGALMPLLAEGTRLNAALPVALGVLAAGYVFMERSFYGFQMRVAGEAEAAARYAGFSAHGAVWAGLLAGGGMAGMAGMAEVAGPMGQLTESISSGYGFAAIIVAFIGRLHPLGIALASLLMALLFLGGEQAQQFINLPASISKVFQGMLLFFLLGADLFITYRLRLVRTVRLVGGAGGINAGGLPWKTS